MAPPYYEVCDANKRVFLQAWSRQILSSSSSSSSPSSSSSSSRTLKEVNKRRTALLYYEVRDEKERVFLQAWNVKSELSSLCYTVSSSLVPNKKNMPRVSIQQNARASRSRAVIAENACTRIVWLLYIMCTLSAVVLACALIGALGLLLRWSVYTVWRTL